MGKKKASNPHAYALPEAHTAHVERCRSAAASKHQDRRTRRNRSRAAQRANAIKAAW